MTQEIKTYFEEINAQAHDLKKSFRSVQLAIEIGQLYSQANAYVASVRETGTNDEYEYAKSKLRVFAKVTDRITR